MKGQHHLVSLRNCTGLVSAVAVYHPIFPEVRGEGQTEAVATAHLESQLVRSLDFELDAWHVGLLRRALDEIRSERGSG